MSKIRRSTKGVNKKLLTPEARKYLKECAELFRNIKISRKESEAIRMKVRRGMIKAGHTIREAKEMTSRKNFYS